MTFEIEKLRVDKKIQGQVKKQMEQAQKEYYLNEKMKASSGSWAAKTGRAPKSTSCEPRWPSRACRSR